MLHNIALTEHSATTCAFPQLQNVIFQSGAPLTDTSSWSSALNARQTNSCSWRSDKVQINDLASVRSLIKISMFLKIEWSAVHHLAQERVRSNKRFLSAKRSQVEYMYLGMIASLRDSSQPAKKGMSVHRKISITVHFKRYLHPFVCYRWSHYNHILLFPIQTSLWMSPFSTADCESSNTVSDLWSLDKSLTLIFLIKQNNCLPYCITIAVSVL